MKSKTESYPLSGRCRAKLETIPTSAGNYTRGCVVTPHGIVAIYAQGDDQAFKLTDMEICFNGRLYSRRWDFRYTERGIVMLARRFAREVLARYVNGTHPQP